MNAYEKGIETVRERGRQAFRDGKGENACPYEDHRKVDGRLTFSRHWIRVWLDGYRQERDKR